MISGSGSNAVFQSLLFWMLFLKRELVLEKPEDTYEVSILVVLDVVLKAEQMAGYIGKYIKFQSLLFWMLFLKLILGNMSVPIISIVSILVVLDVVLKVWIVRLIRISRKRFQSLLFWMLFLKLYSSMRASNSAGRFNPCCFGCCS